MHSPDLNYLAKLDDIKTQIQQADPAQSVFLCIDQLTIYAHPTTAKTYSDKQPLAKQAWQSNHTAPIMGVLNLLTGQVHYLLRNKINIATID